MPRKPKTNRIGPLEEAENAKALDAAAGVPDIKRDREIAAELDVKSIAALSPALTYDTREKLLLKCASEGLTDEFFEKFTDRKELLDLTCLLGIRRLAIIICCRDVEIADVKDVIATMRVVLNMVYGENASMSPEKFIPPPAIATIPTGGAEGIEASVAKFKKFSGK
jgi:hypothetical protein